MFKPVTKGRLYQEIVDQITRSIITGQIKPGVQIPTETELANQFQVSRTVVREAINTLKSQGLVEVTPGRGTFITQPPIETVINSMHLFLELEEHTYYDLVVARQILEIPIASLAAQNATESNIEALEIYLKNMQEAIDEPDDFIRWDTAFHNELANATKNVVLVILVQPILSLMAGTREAVALVPRMVERAMRYHRDLYQAMCDKDSDRAAKVMRSHLDQVSKDSSKAIKRGLRQKDEP